MPSEETIATFNSVMDMVTLAGCWTKKGSIMNVIF